MTLLVGLCVLGILGVLITLLVFSLRCKHAWEFVDKTELPSRMEEAKKSGVNLNYLWSHQIAEMSEKRVVIVLRCPKCGAPKVMTEHN